MAISSAIPTVLGSAAVFTTSALVAVHAVLAHGLDGTSASSAGTISLVSAISEGVVLVVISTHLFVQIRRRRQSSFADKLDSEAQSRNGLWVGLSIVACTAAAAVSVAALISLGQNANIPPNTILGSSVVPFMAVTSALLGVAYATQLFFMFVASMATRSSTMRPSSPLVQPPFLEKGGVMEARPYSRPYSSNGSGVWTGVREKRSISSVRVKSIPYTQTSAPASSKPEKKPASIRSRGDKDSVHAEAYVLSPPGSSSGRSATEHTLRSPLSQVIRPVTSKSRLIPSGSGDASGTSSQRSSAWRPASLAASSIAPANTYARDVRPSMDDFDSWDTSAVDPQNRLTVLERTVSPAGLANRFLETIPASPILSRCPSPPGAPFDLEPPHLRERSRSYSSASSMRSMKSSRLRSQSQSRSPPPPPPPAGEAHIHPLFRSDSPTPPPAVSAGTVVVAAPNGGRILASDAQSLRTLSRMRSGSLPTAPSPLSRQGSFEEIGRLRGMTVAERPHTRGGDDSADEADRRSQACSPERKMTPPIPDWIMSAAPRPSMSGYQGLKMRDDDGAP